MTEDGEILVYYLSEAFERFQPPEEWIEAVATTRGQKQRDDKGYKSSRKASFFFFFFALLSHCSMTLLNWSKASTVNYVTASKQTKNKSSLSGFLINPPPPSLSPKDKFGDLRHSHQPDNQAAIVPERARGPSGHLRHPHRSRGPRPQSVPDFRGGEGRKPKVLALAQQVEKIFSEARSTSEHNCLLLHAL